MNCDSFAGAIHVFIKLEIDKHLWEVAQRRSTWAQPKVDWVDNKFASYTKIFTLSANLQATYVTQCLLGQEPPSTSILEQLCK